MRLGCPTLVPMILRLSDPGYTERLAAFMESLGQRVVRSGPDALELEREIGEAELRIYLRVWNVLYPDATVSVE